MNIFITGGAGFIGSHLTAYHLKRGDKVWVLDNLSTGTIDNIAAFKNHPHFTFDEGDILNWSKLFVALQWANRVYHLAAVLGIKLVSEEPIRTLEINIAGCAKLLQVASKIKPAPKIIVVSSSSVYGHSTNAVLSENDSLVLASTQYAAANYTVSKIADEALSFAYYKIFNLPITIVRLFNTIGLRQIGRYGMVVPRFVQAACHHQPLTIYGDGTQTRSFCDVFDVVQALDKLAVNPHTNGEVINVGNDCEITLNALAALICERANSHSIIEYVSYQSVYGQDALDVKNRRPDLSKLFHYTQFKPNIPLASTIDDLIQMCRV